MPGAKQITLTGGDLFYVGMIPVFTVQFKDASDTLTDPTTITFELELPTGQSTQYVYLTDSEVTKDSVGVYEFRPLLTVGGKHRLRAKSDDTFGAAQNVFFDVVVW